MTKGSRLDFVPQASGYRYWIGVDEAGRGALAGPIVAAAALHRVGGGALPDVADSKLLSPKRREELGRALRQHLVGFAFGRSSVEEVDRLNPLQASLLAMQRAVQSLPLEFSRSALVCVDGPFCPKLDQDVCPIVQGDRRLWIISAASILAKVARDQALCQLAFDYPGYGFDRHKGYGVAQHLKALAELGVSAVHRRSYAPVSRALAAQTRSFSIQEA